VNGTLRRRPKFWPDTVGESENVSKISIGDAFSEPMTVSVVDGEVVVLGPDAVSVSLTPDAAEESARRLKAAASEARTPAPQADPAV
jgi:hypothetical protein